MRSSVVPTVVTSEITLNTTFLVPNSVLPPTAALEQEEQVIGIELGTESLVVNDFEALPRKGKILARFNRDGSPEVFRLLVSTYEPVLRKCLGWKTNRTDQDEIIQQTWLRICESGQHFDPSKSEQAYIVGIARNLATDLCRSRSRRRTYTVTDLIAWSGCGNPLLAIPSREDAPANIVQHSDSVEQIERTIAGMHPQMKEVLGAWLDHSTMDEMSAELGIPVGTVKSRLHKARHLLKEALECGDASSRSPNGKDYK